MKFFNSKYFSAKHTELQKDIHCIYHADIVREITYLRSSRTPGSWVKSILDEYTQAAPILINWRINYKKIEEEWELVEDLNSYSTFNSDKYDETNIDNHRDIVYFNSEFECFLRVVKKEGGVPLVSSTYNFRVPFLVNKPGMFKSFCDAGYIVKLDDVSEPELHILTQNKNGFTLTASALPDNEIDIEHMYPTGFDVISNHMVKIVNDNTKTGLIIMYGDSGTGKTSYIRWLSGQTKRKFVFIPPDIVSQLSKPLFLDFLLENKGLTFIVEDAEVSLKSREGSSDNNIVSTILNLTDGLLGDVLGCQFIFTFNTELDNIDSALLRPGRLLIKHNFTKLSIEEANKYLSKYNSEHSVTEITSLAELTNIDNPAYCSIDVPKRRIGFVNN